MTLDEIYRELLDGRDVKLRFATKQEFNSFRNSLAVYIYRQKQVFLRVGLQIDDSKPVLRCRFDGEIAQIFLSEKLDKPKKDYQVIEDDTTETKEIPKHLGET